MKIVLILSVICFAIGIAKSDDLPKVHVNKVTRGINGIPSIDITFPDGFQDHLVLERYYMTKEDQMANKTHCNFIGHLAIDTNACVAVTGCPGERMEFTVNSKHAGRGNRFIVHTNGDLEKVESAFRIDSLGNSLNVDEDMDSPFVAGEMQSEANCAAGQCTSLPETNLMRIKVGYDDTFNADFGSASAVNEYLDSMFTHVQTFFCDPSLGSKVQLEVSSFVFSTYSVFSKPYVSLERW